MADESTKNKCAHETCDCPAAEGSKFCSVYCEDAKRSGVIEIGCGCEHAACMG